MTVNTEPCAASVAAVPHARLLSLDALRGFAVAAMILVNNPGNWAAVFPQLTHAAWHGCTFADLVFPLFLFIMGAAMPPAFAARRAAAKARSFGRAIVRRSAILIGLGLVLNLAAAWPEVEAIRLPGVLQRIGLTYLIAAPIVLRTSPGAWGAIAAALLAIHWALLAGIPFGGQPAGTMTPEENLAGYVDRFVFGGHMLRTTGDPEGLLGLVSSVATTLVGAVAGWWVVAASPGLARVGWLAGAGAVLAIAGWIWSAVLPFNKFLWTGSFALFTAGLAALGLAACHVLIDVKRGQWAMPLVWLGVNPLAIYFLSELVGRLIERPLIGQMSIKEAIFWRGLAPAIGDAGGPLSSCMFGLLYTVLWIGVAMVLDRRGVRIRI